MKYWVTFACTLLFGVARIALADDQTPAFAKKYPDGLLTGDYGIVTEADLAHEVSIGNERPFNPNEDSRGYYRWQCFPVKDVKPKVRSWRDSDEAWSGNRFGAMCDLDIWVEHHGQVDVYSGRRARENTYCLEYMRNWKRLTQGQKMVCLSGEYDGIEQPRKPYPDVPFRGWTWDQVKTKKGCYSYFEGRCDIAHWKRQVDPKPAR